MTSTHIRPRSGTPQQHYFTVNDVAIDPACSPTHFASAGRDRRVLIWDCERIQEGKAPEVIDEYECDDNPEVVKYHPDGSMLAIQCDDGSVYLHSDDCVRQAVVAAGRGHVTAEIAWGVYASRNLLFASSACIDDVSGHHKAFDVVRNKVVVEFDAAKEACSSLALDPLGERLFIATEGPESRFVLRQFDARTRDRKAVQTVDLEPFADSTDKASMDVNSLSLSPDALYLAAGRTDNWADVYDARMFARGPLHSFAHEDAVSGAADNYGIVKTQWVDGAPRGVGVGLVTGGSDGCVRLWDVRRAADDPLNGTVLARCDYDVAAFNLGDIYNGEKPIVVGERSGKVTVFDHCPVAAA
ncbi:hypothetical protein BN946_scf184977.g43 [Trametes cinnabarina]|uniref:Anaphase-promoting complex subunit 4 WD40 domain-containing protein n=1 Tax=Pycnoporus cinnabarinus TaxID=5643 RepID=A0A060SDT5_PYCCI|nr:hypothetical protein BN946_scf184977.g43 [Trametes cinnabarina]